MPGNLLLGDEKESNIKGFMLEKGKQKEVKSLVFKVE